MSQCDMGVMPIIEHISVGTLFFFNSVSSIASTCNLGPANITQCCPGSICGRKGRKREAYTSCYPSTSFSQIGTQQNKYKGLGTWRGDSETLHAKCHPLFSTLLGVMASVMF
jgi:hypothetical protein